MTPFMKSRARWLAALLFLLGLVLMSACDDETVAPNTDPCPEPNAAAPEVALLALDDAMHVLTEKRCEKVVLLDFWATWCQPCVDLMPALQELHDTYGDQGLEIWAISVAENAETVAGFMNDNGYTFTALRDSLHVAADAYDVTGIPRQFIIDSSGIVQIDLQGRTQIMDFPYDEVIPELLAELPE